MEVRSWADLEQDPTSYRAPVGRGGTVTGEFIEVSRIFYPKGHRPGRHSHLHEQIVTVLNGRLRVTIGDDETIVEAGQVYRTPSNIPHDIEVLEDTEFLSCKNLVDGKGSAAPRVWYETPHGGKGLTDLELEELKKAQASTDEG